MAPRKRSGEFNWVPAAWQLSFGEQRVSVSQLFLVGGTKQSRWVATNRGSTWTITHRESALMHTEMSSDFGIVYHCGIVCMENRSPVRAKLAVQLQTTATRKRLFSATPLKTLEKQSRRVSKNRFSCYFPGCWARKLRTKLSARHRG